MKILLTGNSTYKILHFRKNLVEELVRLGHEVFILAPEDSFTCRCDELGVKYIKLTLSRKGRNIFREFGSVRQLFFSIRNINPDIVFSFTIKNNIYAGLACRLLGVRFVPNVTGVGPAFTKSAVFKIIILFLLRLSFRTAEKIFFQNKNDQMLFVDNHVVVESQCVLLPGSGIDLRDFYYTEHRATNSVTFLFASRLLRSKGFFYYLAAAKDAKQSGLNARFLVIGEIDIGSDDTITESELESAISDGFIEYLGHTDDVRPFIEESDCVVLPTFYNEGTPRILLEACASGRLIITTDKAGCIETVVPNVSGFLVRQHDSFELGRAVRAVCNMKRDEMVLMGKMARNLAVERFDVRIVIGAYVSLLEA